MQAKPVSGTLKSVGPVLSEAVPGWLNYYYVLLLSFLKVTNFQNLKTHTN